MSKRGGGIWGTGGFTLADRCHYIISEISFVWKQGKKSSVGQKDIIFMGGGILKLVCRLRILKKYPKDI